MYAVIETGGKQYRVQPGDIIDIERVDRSGDDGDTVELDNVLLVGGDGEAKVGSPSLDGATVKASLVGEVRGPKVLVFKMKRRKGYRVKNGHRQDLMRVRIDEISA